MAAQIFEREQLAGSNRPYAVDVGVVSVNSWERDAFVPASAYVRPSDWRATGFVYQNGDVAGQTGSTEPAWPTTAGATVDDGSVTWTAAVPPAGDTVASASWSQQDPPDGELTITDETTSGLIATAFIGGGTSGNVYVIVIAVTMTSGAIYSAELVVTIL